MSAGAAAYRIKGNALGWKTGHNLSDVSQNQALDGGFVARPFSVNGERGDGVAVVFDQEKNGSGKHPEVAIGELVASRFEGGVDEAFFFGRNQDTALNPVGKGER